jgi:RHS repeat-associated protein
MRSSTKGAGAGARTTYYVYDAAGQRVRKVTDNAAGTRSAERRYLGGYEVYREYENDGTTVRLERTTVPVLDDRTRIALVEHRTAGDDGTAERLIRYQHGNYLGTVSLELDDTGQVISYEEYSPYGSTTYQAVNGAVQAAAKRYRYTGQERDEENGFTYHGARYYAPWLARWTTCDPAGPVDGTNLYAYVSNNPVTQHDPSGRQGQPPPTQIGDLILYADKVANRAAVGANIQKDHAISQAILKEILGPLQKLYKPGRDLTTVVETGAAASGNAARWHTVKSALERPVQAAVKALTSARSSVSLGEHVVEPMAQVLQAANGGAQLTRQQYLAILSQMGNLHGTMTTEQAGKLAALIESGDAAALAKAVDKMAGSTKGAASWMRTLRGIASAENAAAAATKAAPVIAKAAPVVAKVAPVAKALTSVAGAVSKVAGPLGVGVGVVQMATSNTTEGKIDGGITAASSALMMSKHPVAVAAGAGLMAGQMIEKSLNVSDYSSAAGLWVREKTKDTLGDTGSLILGGVATVAATPSAVGYALAAKIDSWLK